MAPSLTAGCVLALLAAAPFLAAANVQNAEQWGKGGYGMAMPMHTMPSHAGKGDVDVDVVCADVCSDVCTPVPEKVCREVPYETQVCKKVAVPKTKQICNRICTKTTTVTEQVNMPQTVTSSGKGGEVVVSHSGKGHRRLAGAEAANMLPLPLIVGKAMFAKAAGAVVGAKAVSAAAVVSHSGKGATVVAAPESDSDVQCDDVCTDVQIMTYQNQCQLVQNTKTKCDIVYNQKCDKVCKPNCKKITTITTTSTTAMATGKGKGMPVQVQMGKGH